MGLRIDTNSAAISAQRQVDPSSRSQLQGYERLGAGQRMLRGGHESGLQISDTIRAEMRALGQEVRNLQEGIQLAQTADAALARQSESVQRLRDAAAAATDRALSGDGRAALATEARQALGEIDLAAQSATVNGKTLLTSDTVAPLGRDGRFHVALRASTAEALGLAGADLSTPEAAGAAAEAAEAAATRISANRNALAAQQEGFEKAIETREVHSISPEASEDAIRSVELARESIDRLANDLIVQGGLAAGSQANVSTQMATRLLA